jgi:hypothetical protein
MVAWWKRILLSLLSVVAATVVSIVGMVLADGLRHGRFNVRSSEVLLTIAVTVGFCMIAWALSLPVVLWIKKIGGWRFWFYWVLGSCVGPVLMLGLILALFIAVLPHKQGDPWFMPAELSLVYLSGAISSLTSLFYLLLLRRAQRVTYPDA